MLQKTILAYLLAETAVTAGCSFSRFLLSFDLNKLLIPLKRLLLLGFAMLVTSVSQEELADCWRPSIPGANLQPDLLCSLHIAKSALVAGMLTLYPGLISTVCRPLSSGAWRTAGLFKFELHAVCFDPTSPRSAMRSHVVNDVLWLWSKCASADLAEVRGFVVFKLVWLAV